MWSPSKKVVVAEPVPRGQELRQLERTRNKHVEIQATTRGLLQGIDDLLAGRPQLHRLKTNEVVGQLGPEPAEKEQPVELLSKAEKIDSRRIFEDVPPEVPQAEPDAVGNDPESSEPDSNSDDGSEHTLEVENEEVFDEWDDDDMEAKLKRVQNGRLRTDALLKRLRVDKRVALVGQLHEWFSEHMADSESFLSFLSHESFRNDLQKEFEAAQESVKDQVGSTEVSAMLRLNSFLQKLQHYNRKGTGASHLSLTSEGRRRGQEEEEDAQAPTKAQWFKERVAEMRRKVAASEECSQMGTKVTVNIMAAHNLRIVELKRRSQRKDFYCTCEIVGKPASKFETKVVSNEGDPTWNHEAVVGGFEPGDSLRFTVLDESDSSHGDCVGCVTLSSAQILPDGFFGGLVLCVVRESQAKLQVKVSVEAINKNQVRITELLDLIAQQQEEINSLEDDYSLSQKRLQAIEEAIKYVREKQPDARIKSLAKPKAAPAANRAVTELIREAKMEVKEEKFEEALKQNPTLRFKLMKKIETHQLTERGISSRPGTQEGGSANSATAKLRDEKTQALEQECRDLEAEIQSVQQYMVAGDASIGYVKGLKNDGGVAADSEVSDDETVATETATLTRIQTTTSIGTTDLESDTNGAGAEWDSIQVQELLGTIKKTVGNLKQSREQLTARLSVQGLPSSVGQADQPQVSRTPSAAGGKEAGGEEKKKKPGKKKAKAAVSPQKGSKASGGSDPAVLTASPAPSRTPSKRLAAAAAATPTASGGKPHKQQEAEAKLEALRSESNELQSEAARLEARIAELRAGAAQDDEDAE